MRKWQVGPIEITEKDYTLLLSEAVPQYNKRDIPTGIIWMEALVSILNRKGYKIVESKVTDGP